MHQRLGKAVYTVAFTAHGGTFGNPFQKTPRSLPLPASDSLEARLHALGHQNLFVDLRRVPADHPLRKPMVAWPLGYMPMKSVWPDNVDAFFFTDTMFPNTRDAVLPDGVRFRCALPAATLRAETP